MRLHQQCCSCFNLLCKTAHVVETATWKIVCSVRRCPFRRGSSLGSCGQTQWLSHQQRKSSVCHTQTGTATATVGVHKSDSYAELTSSGYHSAHADHVTPCGWQTGKGVPVFWNFILYQILRGWGVISKALPQKSVALSKDYFFFFVGVFHCLTASFYLLWCFTITETIWFIMDGSIIRAQAHLPVFILVNRRTLVYHSFHKLLVAVVSWKRCLWFRLCCCLYDFNMLLFLQIAWMICCSF